MKLLDLSAGGRGDNDWIFFFLGELFLSVSCFLVREADLLEHFPPHSYFSQQVCDYDPLVLFLYKEPNYFFCPLETNEVKKVLMVTSSDRDANTLRTAVRGYWRFSWLRRPDFVFRLNLVHNKERKKQREGDWWCNHNERSRNSSTNCINVHALFSRTVLYGSYKWLHCLRLYNGRHIIHRELMGLLMNTSFLVTTWVKVYIFDLNSLEM